MSASEPTAADPEEPTKVQEAAAAVAEAHAEPVDPAPSTGRRWAVRIVLTLAVVIGIVATLAVWVNRQALNAQNWANTSSSLLQNEQIRDQLSTYIVDQVYANVDVAAELKSLAPTDLGALAAPAAQALRGPAADGVNLLLQQPLIQSAWKASNKAAMQQLINVVEEKKQGVVSTSNGTIAINIQPIVKQAVDRVGLPSGLADKIPADAGQFTVLQSDDIAAVQSYGKALRGLALVLPTLAVLLFALAVWLARGRRRQTLLIVGIDVMVIGAVVLVVRVIATRQAVGALATTDALRPAVAAALGISTRMLKEIGWSLVLTAIPVILAAILAGPLKPAVATRRFLAPWLRDQRAVVYGLLGLLGILIVVWQPVPWTGSPIPILLAIVLVVVGVEVLRRQTNREFADTQTSDALEAVKGWTSSARGRVQSGGAAVSASVASHRQQRAANNEAKAAQAATVAMAVPAPEAPTAELPVTAPVATGSADRIAQLERLAALHEKGILDDDELAEEKRKVLAG